MATWGTNCQPGSQGVDGIQVRARPGIQARIRSRVRKLKGQALEHEVRKPANSGIQKIKLGFRLGSPRVKQNGAGQYLRDQLESQ